MIYSLVKTRCCRRKASIALEYNSLGKITAWIKAELLGTRQWNWPAKMGIDGPFICNFLN